MYLEIVMVGLARLASLLRIMLTPSSATFLSFYLEIVTVGLARLASLLSMMLTPSSAR